MPSCNYSVSVTSGGIQTQKVVTRTSDGPIGLETSVSAGKTVTSWVKTDANTAACDLPGGHGYSNGNFDVFWSSGGTNYVRYGVPGTISTNALSLDGGAGDDFPASATSGVVVCRQVAASVLVDGDNTKILAIVAESTDPASTSVASVTLVDAAADIIAQVDLVANIPQVWDIAGGSANPFTGDVIVSALIGNGSASESLTIKVIGMQDATP